MDKDNVKIVHEEQENNALIEKLKSFKTYINNDLPEWKQLIAIGGFVADVISELKWGEHTDKMSYDEIWKQITGAITYHLSAPYADELNAMWRDWEFKETDKYIKIEKRSDMCNIINGRLEQEYPGIVEWINKCLPY